MVIFITKIIPCSSLILLKCKHFSMCKISTQDTDTKCSTSLLFSSLLLFLRLSLTVLLECFVMVRAVTRSYYRGAAGALLVYDISSRDSYNAISSWLSDARTLASPNIIVILVGNKKDLDSEREVTFMEATRFAQENG